MTNSTEIDLRNTAETIVRTDRGEALRRQTDADLHNVENTGFFSRLANAAPDTLRHVPPYDPRNIAKASLHVAADPVLLPHRGSAMKHTLAA